MSKYRALWQAAIVTLERLKQPAIMFGDTGLAHEIAEEMGWEHEGPKTHDRVISTLARTPGKLIKKKSFVYDRWVCIFHLPNEQDT